MRGTPLTDPPSGRLDFRVLGRLVPLLAGNWPRIGLALACLLAAKGALLAIPFLLKHLVDGLDGAEAPALAGRLLVGLVLAYGAARFANCWLSRTAVSGSPCPGQCLSQEAGNNLALNALISGCETGTQAERAL